MIEIVNPAASTKPISISDLSTTYVSPKGDLNVTEKPTGSSNVVKRSTTLNTNDKKNRELGSLEIKKKIQDFIEISDQRFYIDLEDEHIYLSHEKWSLVGMGQTLGEALEDLKNEAKDLFLELKNDNSTDIIELKDFLFVFI